MSILIVYAMSIHLHFTFYITFNFFVDTDYSRCISQDIFFIPINILNCFAYQNRGI